MTTQTGLNINKSWFFVPELFLDVLPRLRKKPTVADEMELRIEDEEKRIALRMNN